MGLSQYSCSVSFRYSKPAVQIKYPFSYIHNYLCIEKCCAESNNRYLLTLCPQFNFKDDDDDYTFLHHTILLLHVLVCTWLAYMKCHHSTCINFMQRFVK